MRRRFLRQMTLPIPFTPAAHKNVQRPWPGLRKFRRLRKLPLASKYAVTGGNCIYQVIGVVGASAMQRLCEFLSSRGGKRRINRSEEFLWTEYVVHIGHVAWLFEIEDPAARPLPTLG